MKRKPQSPPPEPTRAELEQALTMLAAQGIEPPAELLAHLEQLKAREPAPKPGPRPSAPRPKVVRG